ncbi:hypothetical protein QFC19_003977 [Naganishia cerealis]|uniref:Uncharacterized protein n=1 Tax=Naganishia cerealis TaxID=610337 RepID=A0ACC2W0D6_9TREE|nr:hypothetical protein QFC19_003977 [Naganishia cerealis]
MPLIVPPAGNLLSNTLTYLDAWNTILKRVRVNPNRSAGGLVIFAAIDLDALLASRILVSLLRQEDIPYTLIPIGGYSELEARKNQIFGIDPNADENDQVVSRDCEVHTLILLSLGSLLPIAGYFPLETGCHIHLIDAHRPYNLDNLFGASVNDGRGGDAGVGVASRNASRRNGTYEEGEGEQYGRIWVWTDGEESRLNNVKTSWEKLEYEPDSESSSDESSSESETDEDGEEEGENEEGSATEVEDEEEEGRLRRNAKRKSSRVPNESKRKKGRKSNDQDRPRRLTTAARRLHAERVQKYYHAGTSFGLSVAECCYLLASELERGDNDLLWYAILGLTHQYVVSRIDRDEYDERHTLYIDEVARLNAPLTTASGLLATGDPDNMTISQSEELRFVLFRHWNLYDAMLHSGYVAGRLGVWRDKGRKQLTGLLAKMGYSLRQCQQSYAHMDIALKTTLRDQLEAIAPEYGLVESTYPSFMRAFGYRCPQLSAADAVEGLNALLEAATGVKIEVEQEGGKGGGEWFGGSKIWSTGVNSGPRGGAAKSADVGRNATQNELDEMDKNDKLEQRQSERNFWICYDALQEYVFAILLKACGSLIASKPTG